MLLRDFQILLFPTLHQIIGRIDVLIQVVLLAVTIQISLRSLFFQEQGKGCLVKFSVWHILRTQKRGHNKGKFKGASLGKNGNVYFLLDLILH